MADANNGSRHGHPRIGWAFFGSELKRRREAAGVTQQELGERVYCSASYIGQFEAAIRKPQLDLAQRIDAELGTDGFFVRMCEELINSSPYSDHFADVADLQTRASTICQFGGLLIPGLLQTEGYARELFRTGEPFRTAEETEEMVRVRIARGSLLDGPTAPKYWSVLDESALRRPVGGDAVVAAQLTHIAELVRARKVLVQVLPFGAGAHPLLAGSLALMTFADAPPVAYVEGPYSVRLVDDPAGVARCQEAYDLARAVALSPDVSLNLIQSMAKEHGDAR